MAKYNNKPPLKQEIDPVMDKYIKDTDIKLADEKRRLIDKKQELKISVLPEVSRPPIAAPEPSEKLYAMDTSVLCPPDETWVPEGYVPGECIETA